MEESKSVSSSGSDVKGSMYASGIETAVASAANLPLPPSPSSQTSFKRPDNPTAQSPTLAQRRGVSYAPDPILPAPATSGAPKHRPSIFSLRGSSAPHSTSRPTLLPAALPPKYSLFDIFPFSLLVKLLSRRGKELEGKKAAKYWARAGVVTHNVPLEISLYLVSVFDRS
jgi:hypothetical protein